MTTPLAMVKPPATSVCCERKPPAFRSLSASVAALRSIFTLWNVIPPLIVSVPPVSQMQVQPVLVSLPEISEP